MGWARRGSCPSHHLTSVFRVAPCAASCIIASQNQAIFFSLAKRRQQTLDREREAQKPLPSTLYTEEYFRTACEGYDEFNASEGEHLSRRLASAFSLAEVRPGMKILDVGCGRGEILRHA